MRLFNVSTTQFVERPVEQDARDVEIQNALVRLGARHLRESTGTAPIETSTRPGELFRETLLAGSARHLTALAPVLVENIDRLNLPRIHLAIAETGFARRFPWLLDNVLRALGAELAGGVAFTWTRRYRRAQLRIEMFLGSLALPRPPRTAERDVLDPTIRSRETLDEVQASSSPVSRRWSIVTRLQPEDFARALRASRADR